MAGFKLSIITPTGKAFDQEAISVSAPGFDGYLGVLAHHAPMVAALTPGVVTVHAGEGTRWFGIRGGVLEVSAEGVLLLAEGLWPAANHEEAAHKAGAAATTEQGK